MRWVGIGGLLGSVFVALALSAAIVRWSAFYRRVTASATTRFDALDGLRGVLALAVVIYHAAITRAWLSGERWDIPRSRLFGPLGTIAVILFFMVTGFLFWTKALRARGHVSAAKLLLNRVRRIGPLFLLLSSIVAVLALVRGGLPPHESLGGYGRYILRAGTLGLMDLAPLNRVGSESLYEGMLWTLRYEWQFYLALPLLAPFATSRRWPLMVVVVTGVALWRRDVLYLTFLVGMLSAHLERWGGLRRLMRSPWTVVGALAWLVGIVIGPFAFLVPDVQTRLFLATTIGCWPLFLAVAAGNSAGGLLTLRATRGLGHMSYSVYLLHGSIMYVLVCGLNREWPIATMSAIRDRFLLWIVTACVVAGSACTYRFVEWPFVHHSDPPAQALARC